MHHTDYLGMYQRRARRLGMLRECSPGELLARAAVMHYDDEGHITLKHYAALTGLRKRQAVLWEVCQSGRDTVSPFGRCPNQGR